MPIKISDIVYKIQKQMSTHTKKLYTQNQKSDIANNTVF